MSHAQYTWSSLSFKFTHSSREKLDWRLRDIIWKDREVKSGDSVIKERDAAIPCLARVMVGVMKKIRVEIDFKKTIWTLEIFFLCKMTNYQGQRKNDKLLESMHLLIETLSADHRWNGKLVRGKTKLFSNTQAPHFE